jgi:hypothetical protein
MLDQTPLAEKAISIKLQSVAPVVQISSVEVQQQLQLQQHQLMQSMGMNVAPGTEFVSEISRQRVDEIARTIYVGNLSQDTTELELKQLFSVAGAPLYIKITGDANNASTGRYAFIEFATIEAVAAANNLSGCFLNHRPIKIGRANNPIIKSSAVYVADVPDPSKMTDGTLSCSSLFYFLFASDFDIHVFRSQRCAK